MFRLTRTTDKIGWTHSEGEFAFQSFSRSEPLMRLAEHGSRVWVFLQYLSRSELLMQMAEHASRMWVPFQCLSRLKPLTGWTFIQNVSFHLRDHHHWEEWLNTYPASMFALWYLSRSESLTRMVEHTYTESEFTPQCFSRSEPLTRMTEHSFRKWVCSPVF